LKLKEKAIPVHAFYLADGAKKNFKQIAAETGGRCEELKMDSCDGAKLLINFVTEEVLRITAGEEAVKLYRTKFTFTS